MVFAQQFILILIYQLLLKSVIGQQNNVHVQLKSIKKSLKDFNTPNDDRNFLENVGINEFLDILKEMDKMLETIYEKKNENDEKTNGADPTTTWLNKAGIDYYNISIYIFEN